MLVCCRRPSAGLRMHNSCCAAYGVNFSDNLYYLFRQLLPYSAIVSYALSFGIIRLRVFLFQVVSVPPQVSE